MGNAQSTRSIPAKIPGQLGQRQQTWRYSVSFEFDTRPPLSSMAMTREACRDAVIRQLAESAP
jgi:hypothetical protein